MCKNIRSSLIHNTQKRPKTKIKTNTNSHDQDFKNKKDRLPINALDEESTSYRITTVSPVGKIQKKEYTCNTGAVHKKIYRAAVQ
jgi:hypothetical protein